MFCPGIWWIGLQRILQRLAQGPGPGRDRCAADIGAHPAQNITRAPGLADIGIDGFGKDLGHVQRQRPFRCLALPRKRRHRLRQLMRDPRGHFSQKPDPCGMGHARLLLRQGELLVLQARVPAGINAAPAQPQEHRSKRQERRQDRQRQDLREAGRQHKIQPQRLGGIGDLAA